MSEGMKQFFTRQEANDGKKLPLALPDGKLTDYHLVVRSQWCDAFQKLQSDIRREAFQDLAQGKEVDEAENHVRLCAALIAGWNLPDEFTEENVKSLLREAPQIRDAIDRYASRDARFFSKPSTDSTSGRKKK